MKKIMTVPDRSRVLLSTQRALLGMITPELRAVDVSWNNDEIRLRFTVDSTCKIEMDDELANEIEAEIEGDFLPDASVSSNVLCLPLGTPIPVFDELDGGHARVFARRED